ncbi:MgtC/SapB family protein [Rhodopseudomonas pseudopalustris]|uniref:MgtC/SapB family protein n=1 Tax=Rhodopseudomonas pseudopalustris TaxID=1513892 RepID=UPI003F969263
MTAPWINLAVALALGLFIGLDRERRKGDGPTRGAAGIRTFALTALLGALAIQIGGNWLLAAAVCGLAALTAIAYWNGSRTDPGLTSEVALLATAMIGALAMSDMPLACGVAVAVVAVLAAKPAVHHFAKRTLSETEVSDALIFAIATAVIWPLLPDQPLGPYGSLNPHRIWLLVVLILAIGGAGHILGRLLGPRFGLPILGLASGFASSTATISSMAHRATTDPSSLPAAVAGAALSTVATFVQLGVILLAVSKPTLVIMAPALTAGGAVAAVYGIAFTVVALRSTSSEAPPGGRAFSIRTALVLAATMAIMLMIAATLRDRMGEVGIAIGALFAGLVDTHAAAISVASLVASGTLLPEQSVVPIVAAMTSNALMKVAMTLGPGRTRFAVRVVPGLVISMIATWVVASTIAIR